MSSKAKLAVNGGTPVRTEPFAPWPVFDKLEEEFLIQALHSGKWGGTGPVISDAYKPMIPEFEQAFASLQQAKYAVACCNGTVAITIALQAAGVRPGDEVIVPPYTFIATASAPLAFGAIPVFADVEEATLLIDPDAVERNITNRTKAIIAVHLAGAPANMTRLKDIAKQHGLALIEDAAQAVGAEWEGCRVGAIGDLGTFSFQSTKNLNAGEGGMVVTNSKELWERTWSIVNVGRIPEGGWYQHERIGQNYRITEFQAAVLLAQMTRLKEQMRRREQNAQLLSRLLEEIEGIEPIRPAAGTTRHANHLYLLKLAPEFAEQIDKHDFVRGVQAEGIPLHAGYESLHLNQAIQEEIALLTGAKRQDHCPVSERMSAKQAMWLPQQVLLSDEQAMHDVAEALRKVITAYG